MMKNPAIDRSRLVPVAAAVFVLGLALVGCNRSDDTRMDGTVTPAAPATTPAAPSSDSSGTGGASTATPGAATSGPASAPQGGEALTSTSAQGGGSGENTASSGDASARTGGRDAKETDPQTLTPQEEKQGMPEALQSGHSHSSTALDGPQEQAK